MAALPRLSRKILVDNGSGAGTREALAEIAAAEENTYYLCLPRNLGLAAAINRGVRRLLAIDPGVRFLLLMDQDSIPEPGCVEELWSAYHHLAGRGVRVGCVGPYLRDARTGVGHGFHQMTAWRWRRVYPREGVGDPVSCANLNGSGTLVAVKTFEDLGGLEEGLFIDHVDTEWSFRVCAAGYSLWGVPRAVMRHSMGEATIRYWFFGWRLWPSRAPKRHYYLFRNAAKLLRRPYVPGVWKLWAVFKLGLTLCVHAIVDHNRAAQLREMFRGLREGLGSRVPEKRRS